METKDKVSMYVVTILIILLICFGLGYFILYNQLKESKEQLDQCSNILNEWAINQNTNQSNCENSSICSIK